MFTGQTTYPHIDVTAETDYESTAVSTTAIDRMLVEETSANTVHRQSVELIRTTDSMVASETTLYDKVVTSSVQASTSQIATETTEHTTFVRQLASTEPEAKRTMSPETTDPATQRTESTKARLTMPPQTTADIASQQTESTNARITMSPQITADIASQQTESTKAQLTMSQVTADDTTTQRTESTTHEDRSAHDVSPYPTHYVSTLPMHAIKPSDTADIQVGKVYIIAGPVCGFVLVVIIILAVLIRYRRRRRGQAVLLQMSAMPMLRPHDETNTSGDNVETEETFIDIARRPTAPIAIANSPTQSESLLFASKDTTDHTPLPPPPPPPAHPSTSSDASSIEPPSFVHMHSSTPERKPSPPELSTVAERTETTGSSNPPSLQRTSMDLIDEEEITLTSSHPSVFGTDTPESMPSLDTVGDRTETTGASAPPSLVQMPGKTQTAGGKQMFICNVCQKKCKSKAGLQSHLRVHRHAPWR